MRAAPDDEFKLRFPVAKDRTLRRIAIVQLSIYLAALSSVVVFLVNSAVGFYISDGGRDDFPDMAAAVSGLAGIVFALSFPAAWIVAIIEARVQVRRYGWRAVSDPIEAEDGVDALLWRMREASSDAEQAEYMALVGTDRATQTPLPLPRPLRPRPRRAR